MVRRRYIASLLSVVLLSGCKKKESETCLQFKKESKAASTRIDALRKSLYTNVKAAIETAPKTTDTACTTDGVNPTVFWKVTKAKVAGLPKPLSKMSTATYGAKTCKMVAPQNQTAMLEKLRGAAKEIADARVLIFVEESRKNPELIDKKTYRPGFLTGRLLLYSFAENQVVCAAAIRGESSKRLFTVSKDIKKSLASHLTTLTVKSGFKDLRKVER